MKFNKTTLVRVIKYIIKVLKLTLQCIGHMVHQKHNFLTNIFLYIFIYMLTLYNSTCYCFFCFKKLCKFKSCFL